MYTYPTDLTIPGGLAEAIESFEGEQEKVVLLVNYGGYRGTRCVQQNNRALQQHGLSADDENLVILGMSGTPNAGASWTEPYPQYNMPDAICVGGNNAQGYGAPGGTYCQMSQSTPGWVTLELGGWRLIEVAPRRVNIGLNLSYMTGGYAHHGDAIAWDILVGEHLRMCAEPDFAERVDEILAEQQERAFAQYVSIQRTRGEQNTRDRINLAEQNMRMWQDSIAKAMEDARLASQELAVIRAMAADDSEDMWRKRWREIMDHPKITSVMFEENRLVLITEHLRLWMPDKSDSRYLGRFRIRINFNGNQPTVENLDNPKNGRPHPHVDGLGACFGAALNSILRLQNDGEIYALIDLMVMFLETFNPKDDWGAYAAYWFDVEDETPGHLKDTTEAEAEPVAA